MHPIENLAYVLARKYLGGALLDLALPIRVLRVRAGHIDRVGHADQVFDLNERNVRVRKPEEGVNCTVTPLPLTTNGSARSQAIPVPWNSSAPPSIR